MNTAIAILHHSNGAHLKRTSARHAQPGRDEPGRLKALYGNDTLIERSYRMRRPIFSVADMIIAFADRVHMRFHEHVPFVEHWNEIHTGTNMISVRMTLRCSLCSRKLQELTLPMSNLYLVATGKVLEPHH
jgi:hypothetical protein